ncbi:hypothetical protein A1O3_00147 [Capronia epimyces CBS 606.96]|uniref:Uncharacterized protein n=1 Tax=Capronia epimyces CBS 606.96 TaxID=1182542 RepID=W9ZAQ1_9EURO|nr:uncharacterized protein A1O3_00147 [Capronia epimyces CBS 606.96]EXJ91599.1 hypothetical protein A1O3_00147 [Capronia epimyces CBS 606.96]
MEQALRSQKMSSASARRRKFEERHQQNALERERIQEHKRRLMTHEGTAEVMEGSDDNPADNMDLDVEADVDVDAGRFDRESSVETPSERSVLTPDDPFPNRTAFTRYTGVTPSKIVLPEQEDTTPMAVDDSGVVVPLPSPRPVLQASLATLSDFRYDRYSVFMESPPISEVMSPEVEPDETFSPIEIATPVSFSQPKSRPSLISIVGGSQESRRRPSWVQRSISDTITQLPGRPAKRRSTSSSRSGFPAAEATLFEIPDLPANASEVIADANASEESLAIRGKTLKSRAERISSLPRLSTALNHARMSSIRNFIKTPSSVADTRPFSRSSSYMSPPSTPSLSGGEPALGKHATASSSSSALATLQRPTTAMSITSTTSFANMTALPAVRTPPAEDHMSDALSTKLNVPKKKSFSTLRRRSESIGHAIKGLGKTTTKHDVPLPMLTGMMTPTNQQPLDLSKFPTPPLPSARLEKRSTASLTSTLTGSSAGDVDLGLNRVDGQLKK